MKLCFCHINNTFFRKSLSEERLLWSIWSAFMIIRFSRWNVNIQNRRLSGTIVFQPRVVGLILSDSNHMSNLPWGRIKPQERSACFTAVHSWSLGLMLIKLLLWFLLSSQVTWLWKPSWLLWMMSVSLWRGFFWCVFLQRAGWLAGWLADWDSFHFVLGVYWVSKCFSTSICTLLLSVLRGRFLLSEKCCNCLHKHNNHLTLIHF